MEAVMTYAQSFFGWLLQTTLIASLVICLILLIQKMLGGRLGPRWSHALWLVLLIRMILPWSPSSRVSLSNLITSWKGQIQSRQLPDSAGQQNVSVPTQTSETPEAITGREPESELATQKQVAPGPRTLADVEAQSRLRLIAIRRILPILWLAGAIVIGAYLLISDLALWRIVKRDRPLLNQPMLELFEECKAQMGVQSLVVVVPSDRVRSPGLFGFVRPRLLLPREMLDSATRQELRYVFLHELAHLRRHDIYFGWLTSLLQVLHWFNPLVWFAFYRMRADRELACDALVLTRTGQDKSQEYGGAIVELVRRFSRSRPLPAMAGVIESKSQLKRRIAMIAGFRNNSYRWSVSGISIIAAFAAISMTDATRGTVSTSSAPQAKPAMTMRLVQEHTWYAGALYVSVSPDGKYLINANAGRIAICELATGEEHILKPTKETPAESDPQYPVMSPDNKTIAYSVDRRGEGGNVCLIRSDGSGQRVLFPGAGGGEAAGSGQRVVHPAPRLIQWFPDGSRLLALRRVDPRQTSKGIEVVSVSTSDGSIQVIKSLLAPLNRTTVRLSSDGKYVAYELPSKDAPEKHDIFALDIDSNQETTLVGHAANDSLLDWTPDGRHFLFLSDRLGRSSVWLVPVAQGRAVGTARMVASNVGNMIPIGFGRNGSYFYRVWAAAGDVYTAGINATTGQLVSAPAPLEAGGRNTAADWSPDGKYLAYCSRPAATRPSDPDVIRIRAVATGQEREFANKLAPANKLAGFDCLRWSPDGRSLLVSGLRAYGVENTALTRRVYRIDAATGETTILLDVKDGDWVMMAELSPDGKSLYYWQEGIVRREIDTGKEKTIFPLLSEGPWSGWALSPNGEFIAAGFNEGTGKKGTEGELEGGTKKVLLIPSQGGEATELVRWDQETASFLTHTGWSPDGKTVLFTLHRPPVAGKNSKLINEFWQVSAAGGEPRKIMETDLSMPPRVGFRVHPDGQRIAFAATAMHDELWAMENFLSEEIGK
jgi:beta-lactamase regulating signal transducer with metallopeptidase domain/Tol biopolymer transport system component